MILEWAFNNYHTLVAACLTEEFPFRSNDLKGCA